MNSLVYYLSFYSELDGFLFPDELPANYYSPGLFLVEPTSNGNYPYNYLFDAMDNGKEFHWRFLGLTKAINALLFM